MKRIFILFLFSVLFSCTPAENHTYSFYYWRSTLNLSTVEKAALEKSPTSYLYTHFFDIDKIDGKFQPVGLITKNETFETSKKIIPVVYIKNEVFYDITIKEINFLAKNVSTLIQKKQKEFGFQSTNEIQIDCDWTAGTNKEYFEFLKQLQDISQVQITCTIRIHQVKNRTLSGVPPVHKVYLICYSTPSLQCNAGKKILDVPTLEKYLGNVDRYPLDIDVALPINSYGTVTNVFGDKELIDSISLEDLKHADFKTVTENMVEIKKDGFHFGKKLSNGSKIKVEVNSDAQLNEVRKYLDFKLGSYNIIYYHLDDHFLKNRKL
ncbi:hypothetical protein [Chryseobacterium sp. MP_3.2]|uniref:hypothetical protein n=1 Tax=Chryseobacterium sp. MP_3.2 TaxID=3071712 RepID=UPI002E0BB951|nr:hypothetical protein [Chryseobacterium sp. MP_3.2]